jgi:hypothetical protein
MLASLIPLALLYTSGETRDPQTMTALRSSFLETSTIDELTINGSAVLLVIMDTDTSATKPNMHPRARVQNHQPDLIDNEDDDTLQLVNEM